ncbi:MAG: hypothetical protein ACP5N3_06390 [Candidatus Nanoarchaeia archaeon]
MAETQFVVCRACGRQVRMEQVNFDSNIKAYVCNSCHTRSTPSMGSVKKTTKTVAEKPGIFGGKVEVKEPMVKYSCLKCKYKWSKAKGKPVTGCPYCGDKRVEEVSNEAAKILMDSDKYNF